MSFAMTSNLALALASAAAATVEAYHLLTIVHVFKPHLSCFNLFTTTEATTCIAA
jgi:hypothetical protein